MLPSQTQFFRLIPAEFLTTSHYIFGQVKVTNTGMIGVLSDLRTNYMEVKDANLARVQTPDVVINYSPLMWVVKDRLVAVCLNKREHIGPSPLQRGRSLSQFCRQTDRASECEALKYHLCSPDHARTHTLDITRPDKPGRPHRRPSCFVKTW